MGWPVDPGSFICERVPKMSDGLKQFEKQQFVSLETFRKNGQGVPTPVWFAEKDGIFYITTQNNSGKIKRIRNNGRVRVAPCDMRGSLSGEYVEAQARLVSDPQELQKGKAALNKKYGMQKRMMDLMASFNKTDRAILAVELK
jgi:PPOX class probable F420-dependent enzyme